MSVPPPRHGPAGGPDRPGHPGQLVPADPRALADLAVLVARAAHVDAGGAARLSASGSVLAVWVSPLHGAGLPTVLGLRTLVLEEPAEVDVVVELAALADRLAREGVVALAVPPVDVGAATAWAGVLPPRGGWQPAPPQEVAVLRRLAAADPRDLAGAIARAAEALGFLPPPGAPDAEVPVTAATAGPWRRLTTPRGHVLGRRPLLA